MAQNLLVLSVFLGLLTQCGNFVETKNKPTPDDRKDVIIKETSLDFTIIREQILKPKCMNCHDRHGAYESYAVVNASLESIMDRILTNDIKRVMPPQDFPQITEEDLGKLNEWIDAGALEFSNKKTTPEPQKERALGFAEVFQKVLVPYNCVACHSQYNDYAAVRDAASTIASLVANDKMPFPKKRFQKVDPVKEADKKLLMAWVAQGSPEFEDRPASSVKSEPLKPYWISLRNQVFGPKCILCHNSFGPRGGKLNNFESYTKLRDWFFREPGLFDLEPSSENYGDFVDSMIDSPDNYYFMPINFDFDELETNIPHVTAQEMAVIKQWVKLKLPYSESDQ